MRFLTKIIFIVLFLGATLFGKDVATITALNGSASVQRDGQTIELKLGDKLQEKDSIVTDKNAKVQIIFEDDTIVTVGKNSNFSIKEYLFEDNQEPSVKFGMLKGAMRTITGKIGKIAPDKFSVETKTATIGIRGTNFSVIVGDDGSHQVYCTYGAIGVSVDGELYVVRQGFVIVISVDGKVEVLEFSPQDLRDMKDKNFGKGKVKDGRTSEDATASGEGQLDNTTDDIGDIVIKDISDYTVDAEQTGEYTGPTPDYVIAGYSMTNADYSGSYITTSNTTGVQSSRFADAGLATLDVNFGADTAILTLDGGTAIYGSNPTGLETNTFNVDLSPQSAYDAGYADGTFHGTTGNTVQGNFSYSPDTMNAIGETAVGTFSVTTQQVLH